MLGTGSGGGVFANFLVFFSCDLLRFCWMSSLPFELNVHCYWFKDLKVSEGLDQVKSKKHTFFHAIMKYLYVANACF